MKRFAIAGLLFLGMLFGGGKAALANSYSFTTTTQDVAAPQITSFTVNPSAINVSSNSATVTISLGLTDDLSGVD